MSHLWRSLILLTACTLIVACTIPPRMTCSSNAVEIFARAGRFVLTVTQSDGHQEVMNGGFLWLDERNRYVLDLTSTLGLIQARVEVYPGVAILTRANGEQVRASDSESLFAEVLGSRIPVAGLRDWLQGRGAAPKLDNGIAHDAQNQQQMFRYGVWQVTLSHYDAIGPRLFMLERHELDQRTVLRLVVDSIRAP